MPLAGTCNSLKDLKVNKLQIGYMHLIFADLKRICDKLTIEI